jgi:hypothetical protein
MKRAVAGGAHRGPAALRRQRRTIRLMQILLLLIAASLLLFAGYSWGRVHGFEAGTRATSLEAPRRPSPVQTVVIAAIAAGALVGAGLIGGVGVRAPTPARLDELSGRAEAAAVARSRAGSDDAGTAPEHGETEKLAEGGAPTRRPPP